MALVPVNSSAIAAAGHDGQNLYIQFTSGPKIYEFPGAPYSIFVELVNSDSPGTYYHLYIHGRYG